MFVGVIHGGPDFTAQVFLTIDLHVEQAVWKSVIQIPRPSLIPSGKACTLIQLMINRLLEITPKKPRASVPRFMELILENP